MRMRSLRSLLFLAVLVGVVCFAPASASASRVLGLLTPSVGYDLDPGESVSGQLVAVNDGDENAIVYVYPASQRFDRHGTVDYYTATGDDLLAGESATWIDLSLPIGELPPADQPSVMLAPGERLPVGYTIHVPEDASPGDHSIIVFFEIRDDAASGGKSAGVSGRLGARIKLRTSGDIVRRLRVDPFEVPSCIIGNEVDYNFVLRNTGNVDASTTVTMDVIGRRGRLASSTTIASQTVCFAQSVIENQGKTTLPKNALGFYTLRVAANTDWGDAQPGETTKERAVFAIPLWLLILLIVLAVLVQLRIWWNVNERKRRQKLAERRKRRAEARAAAEMGTTPPTAGDESESV